MFVVRVDQRTVSNANWTKTERMVMLVHLWWRQVDLEITDEQVWPENVRRMLIETGEWATPLR